MVDIEKLMQENDNFVFDLYGTLIDIHTDEWADETWEKFCAFLDEEGITHPEIPAFRKDFFDLDKKYREASKEYEYPEIDILEVYKELFIKYGNSVPENLFDISYKFREASREYMRLFPGVENFFNTLKRNGKKIFILSNAQASYTLPEIEYFKLDKMVDDFIISSDYGCMKPDIHFYDAIVTRNNLDKSRTVMFGDSKTNDYYGALNAGLHGCHIDGNTAWQ